MGILEKLRPSPRWKHADPTVRVAAIYELGPDESDVLHVLGREDGEARVRRAAAARIDDVLVLGDIAKTDPDEDVRTEAVRGLAGIAAEADNPALAIDAVRQLLSLGRLKEIVLVARESSIAEVRARGRGCSRRPAFARGDQPPCVGWRLAAPRARPADRPRGAPQRRRQGRTHGCRRGGPRTPLRR